MTIRSTRTAAAWIAGAGAFWGVFIGASALLLGSPRTLLVLVALLILSAGVVAASLLRPMTLSLEGTDVVYRSGNKEQHVPRADIAGCTLVAQVWSFTDSSGARLLSLNALRFNEADVADFCSQAGISVSGPSQRPVDRLRRDMSSAKLTRASGIVLAVILAAATGGVIYAQYNSRLMLQQYLAAPVCQAGQTGSGASCRQEARATVTSVDQYTTGRTLHLAVVGGGGYRAWLNNPTPSVGDVVDVEVWNGDVRLVNGRKTGTNPTTDPNLNVAPLAAIPGVLALVCFGVAVVGQYQLVHTRAALRVALGPAAGMAGSVQRLRPDAAPYATDLPPCGIRHQPKEQLFVHFGPKQELTGAAIVAVIVAIPVAVFIWLAVAFSNLLWAAPAVLGVLFFAEQMVELWAGNRSGGIYADDLHVAKVDTIFLWYLRRKVYDRKSILEIRLAIGAMTVVGIDGSTLFSTGLVSDADLDRFADFVGGRIVTEAAPQADPLAAPPVKTPEGVLPLSYRRAAGALQAVGGLLLGLGILNAAIRLPTTPADRRLVTLELLTVLIVYGALYLVTGMRLARGLAVSRETALYGCGVATFAGLVALWLATGDVAVVGFTALVSVPVFVLVAYWLREPLPKRDAIR